MVVPTGLWKRSAKASQCTQLPHCLSFRALKISFGVSVIRIGWPFVVDQPTNITHMVHNLDAAFELFEVRTGERGLQTIYRTGQTPSGTPEAFQRELDGILKDMKGEVGSMKRANARRVGEQLAGAWREEGAARKAFEKFLERYS